MPASAARHTAILLLVSLVVLFTNLGGARLWDRDEPRNAGCAREMTQRGDWVTPVFNAELRAHKPILLYWLIMSANALFGAGEFAARFWSAALAVGTVSLTYGLGRRLFDARAGFWAAIALTTSLMFDVAGRAATPDSCLIFFSTAALSAYVQAAIPGDGGYFPRRWWQVAWMYGLMGVAVLAKGPVGAVLPTAVIGMFLLIMWLPAAETTAERPAWRRGLVACLRTFSPRHFVRTCWRMRPLSAIIVILAVAAPWYALVGWRTEGEFLRVFFGEHNLERASRAMEGHRGGPWFYPVAILVGFFPWSIFAGPVIADVAARLRQPGSWRPGYVFSLCWIGVYVGLFSLAQTKLASYVTPCYPALALLTGSFVSNWTRGAALGGRLWPLGAIIALGTVAVAITVAIPLASSRFLPGESVLGLLGVGLLAGAVAAGWQWRRRPDLAARAIGMTAVGFAVAVFGWAVPRVDRHQQNHALLAAIDRAGGHPRVGAFGRLEPTWVYYGGRPIDELTLDPAEAARDPGRWGPKRRPLAGEFFGQGKDRYIITTDRHWPQLRAALPPTATVLAISPLFLRREQLLLIGANDISTDGRSLEPPHFRDDGGR